MIKFLVMDVDGTLTDGKIYMGESGEAFKAFDIKDGCGIKDILPTLGIEPVIITARESKILENRCKELGIHHLYQNQRNKIQKLNDFLNDTCDGRYTLQNCAYIGDDILDLQCMKPIKEAGGIVGCPADAMAAVKACADFVSNNRCGSGAVREFIEYISFQSKWDARCTVDQMIADAISYIRSVDLERLSLGRHQINDSTYFMLQEYVTKPVGECRFESHKNHIDVQWILHGVERIDISNINRLIAEEEYNSEKDVTFWKSPNNSCNCVITSGSYVVLYPEDAHRPCVAVDSPEKVRKLVIKICI